jgi:hypothetical protein
MIKMSVQIKPISNYVSIEEQQKALYYDFMNKKIITPSVDDNDDKSTNSYLSITNKLNILTNAFQVSKDYTSKTFKNYSAKLPDVLERQLTCDMLTFYSSIPKNERVFVYDEILKSMSPILSYREQIVRKTITKKIVRSDKQTIIPKWNVQEVTFTEYSNLLKSLLEYDRLIEKMWTEYDKVSRTKRAINALECVIKYKETEKQLKEYTQELNDSKIRLDILQKIDNGENIGIIKTYKSEKHIKKIANKSDYQVKLQSVLTELIRFCTETLKLREYKMLNNVNYIRLSKQLESDKLAYQTALRNCRNKRRKFMKYRIGNKFAVWKHHHHYAGIKWYKPKNITVPKFFDKVTFNYETRELKVV